MSGLSVEFILSHCSEKFVVEPFRAVFQKVSGSEKVHGEKGEGVYEDYSSEIFCLTVPKTFLVESSSVSLLSGIEKC